MAKTARLSTLANRPNEQADSLLKAGAIFSNDDIIYSTLLDGPYRQARSKAKPNTPPKGNELGKPMVSSDPGRRFSGTSHRVHPQSTEEYRSGRREAARNSSYHPSQSMQSKSVLNPNRPISLGRPMSTLSDKPHPCMEGIPLHKIRSRPSSPRPEINYSPPASSLNDPDRRTRSRPSSPQSDHGHRSHSRPTSPQSERALRTHSRPTSPLSERGTRPHSRPTSPPSERGHGPSSRPTSPQGERKHKSQSHPTSPQGERKHRSQSRPTSPQGERKHKSHSRPTSPVQKESPRPDSRNRRSFQSTMVDNDNMRKPPLRTNKTNSLVIDEVVGSIEKRAQVTPILLEGSKSGVDTEFLENIAGKLAYNHLTKEARLVYFEDGEPPKRTPLPKGNLIPPSQLVMERPPLSTLNPSKSIKSTISLPACPEPPPKSLARRFSARRITAQPQPLSVDDPFSSPFWKESEVPESPTKNCDLTKDIIDKLSKAGATKIANLGKSEGDSPPVSPLSLSVDEDINEKAWGLAANPENGSLRRRPSSAFEKKVKYVPPQASLQPESTSMIRPQNWLSMLRPSGENGTMYIAGDQHCAILCGNLYKLGGNRQWQRRQFRADGFTLVCLSKETIRAPAGALSVERPNYAEQDWRSYCHPTRPPTPRITHPLVATASRDSTHRLEYHQAPKWVIPIGEIVEVSLLTRKGLRVTDSFVIHTRGRNYILKATNQHELASWIYMLQRMIVTYQDCRTLVPGFTQETLPRCASVGELHSSSGLGLGLKPLNGLKAPQRTRPVSHDQTYVASRNERTDSTQRLQQQTRRAPSIFQALKGGKGKPLSDLQLQKEIAQDWAGGLASLSYCRRPSS
ncbi:hypothetical protein DSO57_1028204 [Entomophthora muscae]|uniref:Uncharacterized protein n=1 Tax=Entomophthora muscae TaxID=34485 RepID=A0ACC2SEV9_9FUNG|nr:hypothetical protein DSO57_1028204 [Entomophthora muscae]